MLGLLTSLLLAVGAYSCGVPTYLPNSRIVNGDDAAPHSWPWQVSLQVQRSGYFQHSCGGSLITTRWVLTAAHCVDMPRTHRVVLGEHHISIEEGSEQYFLINNENVFVHPNWDKYCVNCGYDIALLKLPGEAELNDRVQLGCLPPVGRTLYHNQQCVATGWGTLYTNGPQAAILQQVDLPIVDYEHCAEPEWWGKDINPTLICAGGYGKDTCNSDSGGPLNCQAQDGQWYIDGVVSFGTQECGMLKKPTLFTSVSLFNNWIGEVIANH